MRTPLHASQALPRFRAPSVNTCRWPSSPLPLTVTCILTSTPRAQSKPHLAASPHPQDPSTPRALHTDTCWPVSHHRARAWSETDVKRSPNPAYCSEDSPILLVTVASLSQHQSGRHSWGAARPPSPPAICCRRFSLKFAPHTNEISPVTRPPAWQTVGPANGCVTAGAHGNEQRCPGVTVPQRHWSLAPPDPPVDVELEQHFASRKVSEKQ